MRINKYVAQAAGLSRRAADEAIATGEVLINNRTARLGQEVQDTDEVTLGGRAIKFAAIRTTIVLNKPSGYVVSRAGQGSKTIYDLLPAELGNLKPVGRLDKESSGLLLLTDDGELAYKLTHPSFQKEKIYEVTLDKELSRLDRLQITNDGVQLEDGMSRFKVSVLKGRGPSDYRVTMREGRNRQIRRTFKALGYRVTRLHRTNFGPYRLGHLIEGDILAV